MGAQQQPLQTGTEKIQDQHHMNPFFQNALFAIEMDLDKSFHGAKMVEHEVFLRQTVAAVLYRTHFDGNSLTVLHGVPK